MEMRSKPHLAPAARYLGTLRGREAYPRTAVLGYAPLGLPAVAYWNGKDIDSYRLSQLQNDQKTYMSRT